MNFRDLLAPYVTGDALSRLVVYAELLERWSARHNLVRYAGRRELVERHIVDGLAGISHLGDERGRLLDVGSGAGVPGIPILCAAPGWEGVLLEPRQKRWAFLRLVVREIGLRATVVQTRYQEISDETGLFDRITCRAVGRQAELVRWAHDRLTMPGGGVLLWTTQTLLGELEIGSSWRVVSSPLARSDRGVLAFIHPCFT